MQSEKRKKGSESTLAAEQEGFKNYQMMELFETYEGMVDREKYLKIKENSFHMDRYFFILLGTLALMLTAMWITGTSDKHTYVKDTPVASVVKNDNIN